MVKLHNGQLYKKKIITFLITTNCSSSQYGPIAGGNDTTISAIFASGKKLVRAIFSIFNLFSKLYHYHVKTFFHLSLPIIFTYSNISFISNDCEKYASMSAMELLISHWAESRKLQTHIHKTAIIK